MGERFVMRGGQAGEPARNSQLSYFYPHVKAIELVQKTTYGLRILPSFVYDMTMMTVSDMLSVAPYRNIDQIDPESQRPVFTDWYFSLKIHKMIGSGLKSFLSPLQMHAYDERDVDPLHNCYLTSRTSTNPDWRALTDKPDDKDGPPAAGANKYGSALRRYRVFAAMNCMCQVDQNKLENRLVVTTNETLSQLKGKLNIRAGRSDAIVDPDWQEFAFGDVTSPLNGLWATVKPGVFNDAGMKTSLFHFGTTPKDESPVGVTKWPVDPGSQWGQDVLSKRYVIPDMEHVTRVSSAEEILEYIVADGSLPYELIQQACGHRWDIPTSKPKSTTFPGTRFPGVPPVPVVAHQPGAVPPPAPAVAAAPTYWILNVAGGPWSRDIIDNYVRQAGQPIQVCIEGTQDWRWTTELFAVTAVQPAPQMTVPPVPTPPVVPVAPAAPVIPAVPSAPPMMPLPPTTFAAPVPASTIVTTAPQRPGVPMPPTVPPMPPMQAVPPVTAMSPADAAASRPAFLPPAGLQRPPMPPMPPAAGQPPMPPSVPQPPAAPSMQQPPRVPQPPAAPSMQQPPRAPQMPPPPPQAPQAPVAAPAAAAPVAALPEPLNEAEIAELKALYALWETNGGDAAQQMKGDAVQRLTYLSERASANNQM